MIRQRLLKTCAIAALLCAFAQAVQAADRAGQNLAPASGWSIGRIMQKGENATPYCSMKNTYQDGGMLVFARDNSGANSIGLDLKKDVLDTARQYAVLIRVGALKRQVAAIAATRQVLIMQMGVDRAFFSALARKGGVSFSFAASQRSFSLDTSTPEALKALDECSAGLLLGAEFAAIAVPVGQPRADAPAEEKVAAAPAEEPAASAAPKPKARRAAAAAPRPAGREEKQPDMTGDIERLRQENRQLAEKAQAAQDDIKAEIARLRQENEKIAQQVRAGQEEAQGEVSRLKAENEKLAQQTRGQADARAEAQRLKEENERLAQQAEARQREAQAELLRLKAENEKLLQDAKIREEQARAEAQRLEAERQRLISAQKEQPAQVSLSAPPVEPAAPDAAVAASPPGPVREAPAVLAAAPRDVQVHRWVSDDIYGAAEARPWIAGKTLLDMASAYIDQAAAACKGQFARTVGKVRKAGEFDVLESELVCLDGSNDAAAAVLFIADGDRFDVVTQEGTPGQLDKALAKRDSILSAVAAGNGVN